MNLRSASIIGFTTLLCSACSLSASVVPTCETDTQLCPDGSTVSRVAPECTFAPCPQPAAHSSAAAAPAAAAPAKPMLVTSDSVITLRIPSGDFGLAAKASQIPGGSTIPPCTDNFTYCLFYRGTEYSGTNLDSAGISIAKQFDMTDRNACIQMQPSGYSGLSPVVHQGSDYASSVFAPLGDAGAGHFTHEELYRLHVENVCYEILLRIAQSRFENYEQGTVTEFDAAAEDDVAQQMRQLLHMITFADAEGIIWPASAEDVFSQ